MWYNNLLFILLIVNTPLITSQGKTENLQGYTYGMPIKTVFDGSSGIYGDLQLPSSTAVG